MADLAVTGDATGTAPGRRFRPFAALADRLAAEDDRRVLWLPVFFGAGIALYFALTVEPPAWLGAAATIPAIGLALVVRHHPVLRSLAVIAAFAAAGFATIQEARFVNGTPMLERRVGMVTMTGRVIDIDALDRGWRIIVAPDPLPGIDPNAQPHRLRLHIAPTSNPLQPGDRVSLKARLYPVPSQVIPGGRDMQRELYFAGIGGVGYSLGPARHLAADGDRPSGDAASGEVAGGDAPGGGWREWLLRLRAEMTRRINAALPGSTGGVASAVITGKRGAMEEEVKETFRNSGLSHLLAIAGLHLGLVGGFVFFTVRGALALIPFVALRYPIKKIAAAVTLVVLFCYLLISGAAIPTQRAFVMNGIVFAAILIDRLRLSMRICALAALVVLLLDPASLVGVSFQMSFGAVVALVAVYETWGTRLAHLFHGGSVLRRVLGYGGAIAVTTVVATFGTEPFAIYHFHQIVLYSPLANVLAVPISGLWTLPWGVVACLLMPFGLERLALVPMGWGIDATIIVAQWVSALPWNVWSMPHLPTAGAVLVALGGCWLCLWQGRWRLWGMLGVVAGLATMLLTRPPDIVLGDFGRTLAVRAADGDYYIADTTETISRSFLTQETGAALLRWPDTTAAGALPLDCPTAARCTYVMRGQRVALLTGDAGLPIACTTVDAIVAQVPAGFACRSRIPVVDRIDTWRQGAIALWLTPAGIGIESANVSRGERPWVPHPLSARERARDASGRTDDVP